MVRRRAYVGVSDAMPNVQELGVKMIAAYSPQARGPSERSFGTWQGRLPRELRLRGITEGPGRSSPNQTTSTC
jgi:hypothetical protein